EADEVEPAQGGAGPDLRRGGGGGGLVGQGHDRSFQRCGDDCGELNGAARATGCRQSAAGDGPTLGPGSRGTTSGRTSGCRVTSTSTSRTLDCRRPGFNPGAARRMGAP